MAQASALHEDLARGLGDQTGSDRSFGLVMSAVFALVGLRPLWHHGTIRLWALDVAGTILLLALLAPRALGLPNRLWHRLGLLLSMVVSPIVFGAMFFLVLAPIAIVLRALGKDLLDLKRRPAAKSYWIERTPPGPPPDGMRMQF